MANIVKTPWLAAAVTLAAASGAAAASIINKDTVSQTIIVDDGSGRSEISIPAGGDVSVCPNGCLITFPDGESQALSGAEIIEITASTVSIK